MNTKGEYEDQSLVKLNQRGVRGALPLLLLLPVAAWAGGVVTNCTEAALRAAMAGGGVVTFACDGTITLGNTVTNSFNTVLDASGHQITISGDSAVRVFCNMSNLSLTLINLTITNGFSPRGAGICNDGGTLNLLGITLSKNTAEIGYDTPFHADGGAVFNRAGQVSAKNCAFFGNVALASVGALMAPFEALGGAIRNESGLVDLSRCVFNGNKAQGGPGYTGAGPNPGANGRGGAIHNSGTLTADSCSFALNSASGGNGASAPPSTDPFSPGYQGGKGGSGSGGAIYNDGILAISHCAFATNRAAGKNGGSGGAGYPDLDTPSAGGPGGNGGSGNGGALCNFGTAGLVNSTLAWNSGTGGGGGSGGTGGAGQAVSTPGADGGNGGNGGSGLAGIFDADGGVTMNNCTVASNLGTPGGGGTGGLGGSGGPGSSWPVPKPPGPPGSPGSAGTNGIAFGGISTIGGTSANTLLAFNAPSNGSGTLADLGHNLSSDGSCAFSGPGSLNSTDPKLGPLADNGGPTLTMALLPDSPAIDAGNSSVAPTTDQRGFPRPAGLAADIGACEFGSVMPALAVSQSGTTGLSILGSGNASQSCRLLSSADLTSWVPIATNQIGGDGTALFYDTCAPGGTCRFYRLVMP